MSDDTTWDFSTAVEGSDVVVSNGHYSPRSMHKVVKVNKTKVTLDNGSEWTKSGRKWGVGRDAWSRRQAWLVTDLTSVSRKVAAERARFQLAEDQSALCERLRREAKHLSASRVAAINAILDESKPIDESAT